MAIFSATRTPVQAHYCGLLVEALRQGLTLVGDVCKADQHQSNGTFGVHQLRLTYEGRTYRLLLAPAEAPLRIGQIPADNHFLEPIDAAP